MAENTVKDTLQSLLNKAQEIGKAAVETAKDAAEKGKTAVEDHMREREANELYRKLGKKIYKLVSRNELQLPECCDKYIEALNDLYADDEQPADASGEQPACDGEKCDDEKTAEESAKTDDGKDAAETPKTDEGGKDAPTA